MTISKNIQEMSNYKVYHQKGLNVVRDIRIASPNSNPLPKVTFIDSFLFCKCYEYKRGRGILMT